MYTSVRLILDLQSGKEITETFSVNAATVADAIEDAERQANEKYEVKATYTDLVS